MIWILQQPISMRPLPPACFTSLSLLVNIPVEGIRLLDAMCLLLGTPFAVLWSQPGVVCSEKVTFDPLTRWTFQKRTPQGQFRGPPTYTHQVWRRSAKGPRRSRGTNKRTNAARIIVWYFFSFRISYCKRMPDLGYKIYLHVGSCGWVITQLKFPVLNLTLIFMTMYIW